MSEDYFYENRITQSDYRGGQTNASRRHPVFLDSDLPTITFKTNEGKSSYLGNLKNYILQIVVLLVGESNQTQISKRLYQLVIAQIGGGADER